MKTLVKDVMTTKVIWVEQDTPFAAIAAPPPSQATFDVLASFPAD